ncbi:MAG: hypothetical protein PUE01_00655 [Clostridiaceae bacterium]|nr:hypothetical protein [Clostridiaceae bacterium]
MSILQPISTKEFKENVSIRFNNILEGLDNYLNFEINAKDLKNGEESIINFITEVFELNQNEAFVDLYLNNLDEEAQNNLLKICCKEDRNIVKEHINLWHKEPYYKLTEKSLIPFLVRLNTNEAFFVTFYFTKKPITIWGNYNKTFPCFMETKEDQKLYKALAQSHNLT